MVSSSFVPRTPETEFDTFEVGGEKQANSEENFKATKRLNAEDDTDLEKLAQPLDVADTTKKMIEVQDTNHKIKVIKSVIAAFNRNKVSQESQLEDIKKPEVHPKRTGGNILTFLSINIVEIY